ncbi:MAG: sugar transferase [Candidatus Pacebacteria bacterium]|nr:sugar transferase [Candidatus Paceibacterota bacterium]
MVFKSLNRLEAIILFIGDVIVLYASLWATLFLRQFSVPESEEWSKHLSAFAILFAVWLLAFFIAGLYEKHTTFLQKRLPGIILNTQIANSIIGILFFYFIPYFGITPKTTLFIYLVVSFVAIIFWRRYGSRIVFDRVQQPAVLIGSGGEMRELLREVNENPRYGMHFVSSLDLADVDAVDFKKDIVERVYAEGIMTVVIDTKHEKIEMVLPVLYNLIFSGVRFIEMHKVYEDIFDRVPLSLVQYGWFLENISVTRKFTYEFLKRIMDIMIAAPLLILSLILLPFVTLAIWVEDKGSLFIVQERIGRNNKPIKILKVRTMTGSDSGDEVLKSDLAVTKVGAFLRKSRIDELPQLWSVLLGDLSLIGPRPELPAMVRHYESEVPFYNVRHLITPGISGWAQIYHDGHPHHGTNVEETRTKLSYDLFYLKNRSFGLDLKIALKTLKTLLSRAGI